MRELLVPRQHHNDKLSSLMLPFKKGTLRLHAFSSSMLHGYRHFNARLLASINRILHLGNSMVTNELHLPVFLGTVRHLKVSSMSQVSGLTKFASNSLSQRGAAQNVSKYSIKGKHKFLCSTSRIFKKCGVHRGNAAIRMCTVKLVIRNNLSYRRRSNAPLSVSDENIEIFAGNITKHSP